MKRIIVTLTLLFLFITVYSQYPEINNNRPRIYVDSTRFAWLQNNVTIPGDCKDTYDGVVYAYNNWWITDPQLYLVGSDSTVWTWDWSSQWAIDEAVYTAFLYKVSQDPLALKRCRFIVQHVINRIDTVDYSIMWTMEKEQFFRDMSEVGGILLDWCYNELPAALQNQFALSMYEMNREFMNTFILSSSGNSYVSSHNTYNCIFSNQNALVLFDASGLSSFQKDTVVQWFEYVYDKHINEFLPVWSHYRNDDGGWNWGAAYAMWSLRDQFQLFENMRIGTNKNFYADYPWIENSINQYLYFLQPNNYTIHLGDGLTDSKGDIVMYMHGRIYNDPRSLWLAQYWSEPSNTPYTEHKYNKLLYKDFNMPVVYHHNYPLNWWSDKVGLSISRSSWNNDATMVSFYNSPSKRAAHEHRDNNSFAIFKNAPLLIDAGHYDTYNGTHYRNYYQRTIAHNSICVFDSTDTYECFGQSVSNDGGQIESDKLMNYNDIFLPENQRGEWIQYADGINYSYNIADAQLSYDSTKLSFFRRRLLYIKPERVIVLDHVHLKNTASNQRDIKWIAHFAKKPIISGTIINTIIPNHIETFDGNMYYASNGNGSVAIKTLLPDSITTTLIGGTDYEYWVDGVNYPPQYTPDSTKFTPGKWRIEVEPTNNTDTVIFLHTLDIGDTINNAFAGGLALQNSFSVGTDWNDTLFFFANDANNSKFYHMFDDISGGRTIGVFALDMDVGTYNIDVNGQTVATATTDTNGILQSTINLMPGSHLVEIADPSVNTKEINKIEPLVIFPNPANSVLNIVLRDQTTPYTVNVYDNNGKLLISKINSTMLNISELSSGHYILEVMQRRNNYSAKFIKE